MASFASKSWSSAAYFNALMLTKFDKFENSWFWMYHLPISWEENSPTCTSFAYCPALWNFARGWRFRCLTLYKYQFVLFSRILIIFENLFIRMKMIRHIIELSTVVKLKLSQKCAIKVSLISLTPERSIVTNLFCKSSEIFWTFSK